MKPHWAPSWFPNDETVGYISGFLTAGLLILVAGWLVHHLWHGGKMGTAATTAAGVGVGGAGT